MKLAFVVQRYGRDIVGGSETLARQIAERLARRHDITALTSTAKDYLSWKNEFPAGESKHRGVTIRRFPVVAERDLEDFNEFSKTIYEGEPTVEDEIRWLHRQGPVVPSLVQYLQDHHRDFDLILFFTYLYYPTFYGLQIAPEKSLLLPTAHDEPPLKLSIFAQMFQLPEALLFNAEAEELLVLERFPVHKRMRETIGMGLDLLEQPDSSAFRREHQLSTQYLLYAGRIDSGKGCDEMIRFFRFFKEENPSANRLQLVLIGKLGMKLPEDDSIRYLGYVSEADKFAAMVGATALIVPSRMESLSIVTLEAFSVNTPVIAHAGSKVVVDHCRKSNAGLYYGDFEEFEGVLNLLLKDKNVAKTLGRNGQRYVKENYGWARLLDKYEKAFQAAARSPMNSREPALIDGPVPPPPSEYLDESQLLSDEALAALSERPAERTSRRRPQSDARDSKQVDRPTDDAELALDPASASSASQPEQRGDDDDSGTQEQVHAAEPPTLDAARSEVSTVESSSSPTDAGPQDDTIAMDSETAAAVRAQFAAGPDQTPGSEAPDEENEATSDSAESDESSTTNAGDDDGTDGENLPSFFQRSIPDSAAPAAKTPVSRGTQALAPSGEQVSSQPPKGQDPPAGDARDGSRAGDDGATVDKRESVELSASPEKGDGGLPAFFRSTVPTQSVPEGITAVPTEIKLASDKAAPDKSPSSRGGAGDELPEFFRQSASSPSEDAPPSEMLPESRRDAAATSPESPSESTPDAPTDTVESETPFASSPVRGDQEDGEAESTEPEDDSSRSESKGDN